MTPGEIGLAVVSGIVGATFGAIGGAFGATRALRTDFTMHKEQADDRLTRVETRVGLNHDGSLTGNGLISRVGRLEERMEE